MLKYELKFGSYYLIDESTKEIVNMTDSVSVAYDYSSGLMATMLKHGKPEDVVACVAKLPTEIRRDVHVLTSDKWDVNELNKVLSTSGYIGLIHDKINAPILVGDSN